MFENLLHRIRRMPCIVICIVLTCITMHCLNAVAQSKEARTGNTVPNSIDIRHIALDLRFDWQRKQAIGSAAITFSVVDSADFILLDAALLSIDSINSEDGKPLKFSYNEKALSKGLKIFQSKRLQNERTNGKSSVHTLKVYYHTNYVNDFDANNIAGSNSGGIRFMGHTSTEPRRRKQIWSAGFPYSNKYWFPCNDVPDDLRTTEFTATVEQNMTVVSNGTLVSKTNNRDSTCTFHFKMDKPYANYNTGFVIGEYTDLAHKHGQTMLHNYAYPDEAEATAASVARLPDMMDFYSRMTGCKYPYADYSQVFVQYLPWGMAHATASVQTENMVDDHSTHAEYLYLWDMLEGESLAQQWFGGIVSHEQWSDVWLTKALARYFSELYDEYKNGRAEYLLYQHTYDIGMYLVDWNAGVRQPVVNTKYDDLTAFANSNQVSFHGASVLNMLRGEIGDKAWWQAIRLYVRSYAGKTASTADFVICIEAAAGRKMDWFFDQWVYKAGHPKFVVTKHYDTLKKELTLIVKQNTLRDSAAGYEMVKYFRGNISIEIDNRIERIWLEPTEENVLTFTAAHSPVLVNFDYEREWVKELVFEKPTDEWIWQFQHDKDILGRQQAMMELARIAKDEKTTYEDKEKIFSSFRNVIGSNVYWRLKYNAIVTLQGLLIPVAKPTQLDDATVSMLLTIIQKEQAWTRSAAISFLGKSCDVKYADLYIKYLGDSCNRVVNAAAIALGKCKSQKAFDALVKLKDKPSWKNQSLISTLNGLKELGDPRGFDIAFKAFNDLYAPRWTLAVSTWDFRIAAAETIVALKRQEAAYPVVLERFKKAMQEDDVVDIFNNALLTAILADPHGKEIFEMLKVKYKNDPNAMIAIGQYETQFNEAIKPQ